MLQVSRWLQENKWEYEGRRAVRGNEDFIITRSGEPASWEHRQYPEHAEHGTFGVWKNLHLTPLSLPLASLSL